MTPSFRAAPTYIQRLFWTNSTKVNFWPSHVSQTARVLDLIKSGKVFHMFQFLTPNHWIQVVCQKHMHLSKCVYLDDIVQIHSYMKRLNEKPFHPGPPGPQKLGHTLDHGIISPCLSRSILQNIKLPIIADALLLGQSSITSALLRIPRQIIHGLATRIILTPDVSVEARIRCTGINVAL